MSFDTDEGEEQKIVTKKSSQTNDTNAIAKVEAHDLIVDGYNQA